MANTTLAARPKQPRATMPATVNDLHASLRTRPPEQLLLVCRGNLCRSPMASAVLQQRLQQWPCAPVLQVDTAGTHACARARRMDARAAATLQQHGYAATPQRTRCVRIDDFLNYDLVLAMDCGILADLQALCPSGLHHKLQLFLQHAHNSNAVEVPDPYFGNAAGFERVLRLCEAGAEGLIARWRHHPCGSTDQKDLPPAQRAYPPPPAPPWST